MDRPNLEKIANGESNQEEIVSVDIKNTARLDIFGVDVVLPKISDHEEK